MTLSLPRVLSIVAIALAATSFASISRAGAADPTTSGAVAGDAAHGKYLVNNVGMCIDCHGPTLQGLPLPFKPTIPIPWSRRSPKIAGLPMFASDASAVKFFRTGVDEYGHRAKPPMPGYRMNDTDANDLVAYLRSLRK